MSGHNKWSAIKHKKAKEDAKKGKVFTKLIKEITVAAREGGGDMEHNARLRHAITSAKSQNMPNDNIERAIKKGTGDLEGVNYESLTYEGYGPGGVAIFIEVLTDNKNRSVADIRSYFTKYKGNLASNGAVSWMFQTKGEILIEKELIDEDALMEFALEAGADDITDADTYWAVLTEPNAFNEVVSAIEEKEIKFANAEITKIAENLVSVTDSDAKNVLHILDKLDNCDDVQKVYSNADFSDKDLEEFNA